MRNNDPIIDAELTAGHLTPVCEVTSWLGGRYLGTIPVAQGEVIESATDELLGSLEISVPATSEWIPSGPGHPLAAAGQELIVRRGYRTTTGDVAGMTYLGRYRTWSAAVEDGYVRVHADSPDKRLSLARFVVPTRTSGTLSDQASQIVGNRERLTVLALDRTGTGRTWEIGSSRLDALNELCDAWGTALRIVDGSLTITPTQTSGTPTLTITDGGGGVVVSTKIESTTDGIPNAVVASSAPEGNEVPISGIATIQSGPYRWQGPYGEVPEFFTSPLLTTASQVQSAAETRLKRAQSKRVDLTISMPTDPRITLDDIIAVRTATINIIGQVTRARHALTLGKEPGEIGLRVLSGTIEGVTW